MLTPSQYSLLLSHIKAIAEIVPYQWGRMQVKAYDRKLPKLYEYQTYDELNEAIANGIRRGYLTDTDDNNYYRHRWFVYKCSELDEYLFNTVTDNKIRLELKGQVFYNKYNDDIDYTFRVPLKFIDSLYKQQCFEYHRKKRLENRLFIAYHSFVSPAREPFLRTMFDEKENIFREYNGWLTSGHKLFDYLNHRKADLILLIEQADGTIQYGIVSENLKGSVIFHLIN